VSQYLSTDCLLTASTTPPAVAVHIVASFWSVLTADMKPATVQSECWHGWMLINLTLMFLRTKWFAPECAKLLNWFANIRKCVAFCDANHLIFITDCANASMSHVNIKLMEYCWVVRQLFVIYSYRPNSSSSYSYSATCTRLSCILSFRVLLYQSSEALCWRAQRIVE